MVNPAGETVLRQVRKDVLGKSFRDLAAQLEMGDIILEGLQETPVEFSPSDNPQIIYQIKITALRDRDDVIGGSVVLIYDISEWKRSQKRLTDMATIDFMTGIYNRQHFINLAQQELLLYTNERRSCSVILIDVDHFKSVNDTYGHLVGDQVLKHIVNLCRDNIRRMDVLGRFGGEEFIIFLPDINMEIILSVAERVRLAIHQSALMNPQGDIHVSVSMGIAVSNPDKFGSLDHLLEQADQALYKSKNGGRNCISVYSG